MGTSVMQSLAGSPNDPNFQPSVGALGASAANALPRVKTDAGTALALATKWYTYYFTRYVNDPATQQSGISYWQGQIEQDGPMRAWANFAGSPQPVADGVEGLAAQLAPVIGNQYYAGTAAGTTIAIQTGASGLGPVPPTISTPIVTASPPINPGTQPAAIPSLPVPAAGAPAAAAPAQPAAAKVTVANTPTVTPWYETPIGLAAIALAGFIVIRGGKHLLKR